MIVRWIFIAEEFNKANLSLAANLEFETEDTP